uniref:Niemann-pick type C2 protein n=1 Tax=Macrocentrus cingulum TaxID=535359 RepID=A0A4P8XSB7_9HYME|nr:Niemann-pick type C2 protein [Macrocentrus cingulum]
MTSAKIFILWVLGVWVMIINGYEDCTNLKDISNPNGTSLGTLQGFNVSDCDVNKVCIIDHNSTTTLSMDFTLNERVEVVNTKVEASLGFISLELKIGHPAPCNDTNSGLECPLEPSDTAYHYTVTDQIKFRIRNQKINVKWSLLNEDAKTIVCAQVAVMFR